MEQTGKRDRRRGLLAAMAVLLPVLLCACAEVEPSDYRGLARDNPGPAWPHPTYFTVMARPGDSVASVAQRYDVSESSVARMNGLDRHKPLFAGEILRIPPGPHSTRAAVFHEATGPYSRVASDPDYAPPPPPPPVSRDELPPPPPAPRARHDVRDAYVPPPPPPAPRVVAETQSAPVAPESYGSVHFGWPVEGPVISAFGSSSNGERNDGINIAVKSGEPIHAAAAGTVTYSGNELKGYGNLVLIRHDDGYVTAYAHADSITVNRGDRVEKGQVIGYAGSTGDVDRPQLHFEIRHGVEPVDPKPLLTADRTS